MRDVLIALIVSLVINMAMFAIAYRRQTDKLTDISYALTFVVVVACILSVHVVTPLKLLLVGMVTIWAARLGGYLLMRIHKMGKDSRFDGMRNDFVKFGRFWLSQAVAVWLILMPVVLVMNFDTVSSHVFIFFGFVFWATGLSIESAADWQKFMFMQHKSNKGKWIDSGLWHYSRHPNYLGEIMVWIGVYLVAASSLGSWQLWVGLASPLFISVLLLFVSGIPPLEKGADERWGLNPAYQKYKQRTSILLLMPPKK